MIRERVALGLASALIMIPAAVAAPLPNLKGHSYDEARSTMIKFGYRPVRFIRTEDGCMLDKTCKRYPELLDCSTADPSHCRFAFKSRDGHKYVVVTARGKRTRRVYSVETASRRERRNWPMIARR